MPPGGEGGSTLSLSAESLVQSVTSKILKASAQLFLRQGLYAYVFTPFKKKTVYTVIMIGRL